MNPEQAELLLQLNDIAAPAQPGWWPLAIGWWFLMALVLLAGYLLLRAFSKVRGKKRRDRWRRTALHEHQQLRQKLKDESDVTTESLAELSVLMRRVALAIVPRGQVASITDHQWLSRLDDIGGTDEYSKGVGQLLSDLPYVKPRPLGKQDLNSLLNLTEDTIRKADKSKVPEATPGRNRSLVSREASNAAL